MTLEELDERLAALKARVPGDYAWVSAIATPGGRVTLSVDSDGRRVYRGDGQPLEQQLTDAAEAIEGIRPDTLARTLGIEPQPEQVAAE